MPTAAELAAQGVPVDYADPSNPAWKTGAAVDPRYNPYFGAGSDNRGVDQVSMGSGNGMGYLSSLYDLPGREAFYRVGDGHGENANGDRIDGAALADYLSANGLTIKTLNENALDNGGRKYGADYRWLEDAQGNLVGNRERYENTSVSDMQDFLKVAAAAVGGQFAFGGDAVVGASGVGAAEVAPAVSTAGGTAGGAGTITGGNGITLAGAGTGAGSVGAGTVGGSTAAGVAGMNAGNWIQLAGMGLGAIGANRASGDATDAANRATDAAKAAAADTAALGREQLDFTKTQYYDTKEQRDAAAATALEVSKAQLASQQQQDALAKEYADYNRTTFRPLEQGIVKSAEEYDTPEKRAAAAASAIADVDMGAAAVQQGRARQLAASGVNPGSAKAMSIMGSAGLDQARSGAGAAYQARKGVETTGFARKMDAASLGRNLPSAQATSAGLALTAGNSAVGNAVNGVNVSNSGVSGVQAGYGQAANASAAAGNLYSSAAAQAQRAADTSAQLWSNLGTTAGVAASRWSDENLKEDVSAGDPEAALAEVTATPIKNWRYAPAALAKEGITMPAEEMGENVGPMAQGANATMGEQVAPGGKKLNMNNLVGKALLSVQALDKKVSRLASMIEQGQLQGAAA